MMNVDVEIMARYWMSSSSVLCIYILGTPHKFTAIDGGWAKLAVEEYDGAIAQVMYIAIIRTIAFLIIITTIIMIYFTSSSPSQWSLLSIITIAIITLLFSSVQGFEILEKTSWNTVLSQRDGRSSRGTNNYSFWSSFMNIIIITNIIITITILLFLIIIIIIIITLSAPSWC